MMNNKGGENMKSIKQVSQLTGVSVRTLQYYDQINLLKPTNKSEAGYRLYDDKDIEKLQQILFFKELDFKLEEIKTIMENPKFDKIEAYHKQKRILEAKYNRIGRLIELLEKLEKGEKYMDSFKEFDLTEYFEALQVFKKNNEQEVIKHWGSMEAFDKLLARMKINEENVAKSAIEWYGSVEKYTEAMKDNLEHFSERIQKVEALKDNGYIQQASEKGKRLTETLLQDITKPVDSEEVQILIKEMVMLAEESATVMDEKLGENYWKTIINRYLYNDTTKQAIDKIYKPGASEYIGSALQYYFQENK